MLTEHEVDDLIEYVEHKLVELPNDDSWRSRLDGLRLIQKNYCLVEALDAVMELNPIVNERVEKAREQRSTD